RIKRRSLGLESRAVCKIDHNDLGWPDLIQHRLKNLIEVVPVSPVADDQEIPVQQAIGQPMGAGSDAGIDRRRVDLAWCPDHMVMIFLAASMDLEQWGSVWRERGYLRLIQSGPDLPVQDLAGGFDQDVD